MRPGEPDLAAAARAALAARQRVYAEWGSSTWAERGAAVKAWSEALTAFENARTRPYTELEAAIGAAFLAADYRREGLTRSIAARLDDLTAR